jgi:hypothetical protein
MSRLHLLWQSIRLRLQPFSALRDAPGMTQRTS